MGSNNPFTPGQTVTLSVTDTTGNVALGAGGRQVHISTLPGDDPCYIRFGNSAITVTTANGMRINPGQTQIFTVPEALTHVAAICASTETAALSATMGEGAT